MNALSKGFSLLELLTVIAVISILMATSTSFIPSLLKSNQVDANVSTLSGIFEQAREAAISGNTYVYVVFTGPLTTTPAGGLAVAVIESQDGTDALNNFAYSGPINAANDLMLLHKVQGLSAIKLLTQSQTEALVSSLSISSVPSISPAGATMPSTLNLTLAAGGSSYTFTQGVMFKPDGEALVSTTTWNDLVEFGLQPLQSATASNVAVMRLTRLTGRLTVYRQ
jgi:prepilin-type N-terminal cleavage/methylation domain-containing protein